MTPDIALRPVPPIEPARLPPREPGDAREAPAAPAAVAPVTPNPRLRLDGSLGMVVIEFRDQAGSVANSIPSPRVIEAYRAAAMTDAPVPVGIRPQGRVLPDLPAEAATGGAPRAPAQPAPPTGSAGASPTPRAPVGGATAA